jgi:hypothetical protein
MNNDPEIKDIVAKLQQLNIQQSELLQRLELLSHSGDNAKTEAKTTLKKA